MAVKKQGLSADKADLVNAFLEFSTKPSVADVATDLGFVPDLGASKANQELSLIHISEPTRPY